MADNIGRVRAERVFRERTNWLDELSEREVKEKYRLMKDRIRWLNELIRDEIEPQTSRSHAVNTLTKTMSAQANAKRRLKYAPEQMARAIAAVKSGSLSKKMAAKTFSVPRTTLLDKLSGRVPEVGVSGRKPILNNAEETTLVNYSKLMQEIGYPLTRPEFLKEVKKILDIDGRKTPFTNNLPGKKWFRNFVARHSGITMRKPQGLGQERANVTLAKIQNWYDVLFAYLEKEVPNYERMIKNPRRIFNGDESGFPLSVKPDKVMASKGATNVYQVISNTKLQITVMAACNAVGEFVPPMILFPGERLTNVGLSGFEEAVYRTTKSGWMDTESFLAYVDQIVEFAKEKDIEFPIILFVDGHSTHMSLPAAEFCRDNQVVLYCLVPNATHLMQPLDVGFFSPMKNVWKQTVKAWQIEHFGETVGKKDFPGLLKKAWGKVATFENASHGFRKSGLYPLSITGIDSTKLGPSQIKEKAKEHNILSEDLAISNEQPERESGVQGEATRASEDITDSCDEIVESISKTPSNKQETVAPAFQKLFVPCPKEKRKVDRIGERLPKAISGARAIEMLKERENKKRQEEEAKAKRKEERLQKKVQKEEEKERKRIAREEKRKMKAESTASKNSLRRKKRKAKHDESDSENEHDDSKVLCDDDSDDTMEEFDMCPVCNKGDQHPSRWVRCEICDTRWHFMCADRPEYELLDEDERKKCEFVCPMCQ